MSNKSGIDANTKATGRGYVQGTGNLTMPFVVNPANNRLLIEVVPIGVPLANLVASRIHIDANTHQIGAGVTNDANEFITPLTTDSIVGLPCLRVEIH